MLAITGKQMEAFQAQELRRFRVSVIQRLRSAFPDEYRGQTDAEIGRFVDWGIEKAKGYGIDMEPDVAQFIELVSGFGTDFDRNPRTVWMHAIFRDVDRPAPHRLTLVIERLAFGEA